MVQQLDVQLWMSGSCGCYTSCWKRPLRLASCSGFPNFDSTPATSPSQSLRKSGRAFTTCAQDLWHLLEGQEVSGLQMDPGTLQLTLQLVRRETPQIVTATAMHFIPGKKCFEGFLVLGCDQIALLCAVA